MVGGGIDLREVFDGILRQRLDQVQQFADSLTADVLNEIVDRLSDQTIANRRKFSHVTFDRAIEDSRAGIRLSPETLIGAVAWARDYALCDDNLIRQFQGKTHRRGVKEDRRRAIASAIGGRFKDVHGLANLPSGIAKVLSLDESRRGLVIEAYFLTGLFFAVLFLVNVEPVGGTRGDAGCQLTDHEALAVVSHLVSDVFGIRLYRLSNSRRQDGDEVPKKALTSGAILKRITMRRSKSDRSAFRKSCCKNLEQIFGLSFKDTNETDIERFFAERGEHWIRNLLEMTSMNPEDFASEEQVDADIKQAAIKIAGPEAFPKRGRPGKSKREKQ